MQVMLPNQLFQGLGKYDLYSDFHVHLDLLSVRIALDNYISYQI
ncbi:hypothetical protein SDC9_208088 [bioreactor metagenome]|uniref:Uncharacterized protein n=1 Tax=bioreactor metagenome TaxID=1076179 RepID=A0A645JB35_9ZZZZ